jgi:hypothetical protein
MRILVCGGRSYSNKEYLYKILDSLVRPSVVIHGNAAGADSLADAWAIDRGITAIRCPAKWSQFGRVAGPLRNQFMLDFHKPDVVVAFPGGAGTAHMVSIAKQADVLVINVKEEE